MENRSNYTTSKTSDDLNYHGRNNSKRWLLPVVLTLAVITGFALFMNTTDDNVEDIEPASGYSSTTSPTDMDRENVGREISE